MSSILLLIILGGALLGAALVWVRLPKQIRPVFGVGAAALLLPWALAALSGGSAAEVVRGKYSPLEAEWYLQPAFIGALLLTGCAAILGGISAWQAGSGWKRQLTLAVVACPLLLLLVQPLFSDKNRSPVFTIKFKGDSTKFGGNRDDKTPWVPDSEPNSYSCSGLVLPGRSVSSVRRSYSHKQFRKHAIALLDKRFPSAAWVARSLKDPKHFDVWFGSFTGSWSQMLLMLSAAVHESVHILASQSLGLNSRTYPLENRVLKKIPRLRLFDRNRILARLPTELKSLSYNKTYLTGKSGRQGLDTVLNEFNAYTWTLLVDYAILDQFSRNRSRSARDGLLAFMIYLDTYLNIARTSEPAGYKRLLAKKPLRDFIVFLWDRARCVLALSGRDRRLGQKDRSLRVFVFGSRRLNEIRYLRQPR